jgi:uncharacterized linocin/CFP29 family protein
MDILKRQLAPITEAAWQDISIGYESHDSKTVRLYFSESFAFRVPGPEAVVPLAARETG